MKKVSCKNLIVLFVFCAVTLFMSSVAFGLVRYEVIDLGIPDGDYTDTTAKGINDSGQVAGTVGSFDHPDGDDHSYAFVWNKSTGFQVLGDSGYKYLEAMRINYSGQVAGGARAYSGNNYALLWENGSITNLGIGRANDINNSGQIVVGNQSVGSSFILDSSNGKQFLSGSDYIYPWGINDLGQVVGDARNPTPGFDTQAFIWDSTNGLKFLYQPAEYMTSSAQDINESGSIVGYAHDVNYPHPNMPVLWSDANTNVKLGEYPGRALAINEAGQVVGGVSMPGEGYIHGFVWDEVNGLRDLTELVSPYQGLEFIGYATDINEAGQIVATARIDGESHAVLLIPFDEIQIDIRPEVYPNTINTRSKTVTVAILSSTSFYAPDDVIVNRLSLTFGPTGDEQSLLSCATRKPKDVNGDTLKDLVCTFSIKDAGFISGDEVGILKGTTETGTSFEGSDEVLITTPRK